MKTVLSPYIKQCGLHDSVRGETQLLVLLEGKSATDFIVPEQLAAPGSPDWDKEGVGRGERRLTGIRRERSSERERERR